MHYIDRRLNAWVLEVPPHGHIVLRPGCVFTVRLIGLAPSAKHVLTVEGRVIGAVLSDSAGNVYDTVHVRAASSDFLGRVVTFDRVGASPVRLAASKLERDV